MINRTYTAAFPPSLLNDGLCHNDFTETNMHSDVLKYDGRLTDPLYKTGEDAECAECEHLRGLLLWTLYHHQGGHSEVGQPIRRALGIGQYDHMTPEQIEAAKDAAKLGHNAD